MKNLITQFAQIIFFWSLLFGLPIFQTEDFTPSAQAQYIQLTPDQMKAALFCPTDESKKFIDDCFALVQRGILPESLVLSAFQYAINKPKNRWVYFETSLSLRCERMGINLAKEIAKL
ncbi:MAG: hypothetical protein E7028_00030 [Planctomycetaceae bacterium]|nr:hypothetical protein [Planctomycetaceae bacterium]MBQ2822133.1 hypothetical protein [Thermoguttaceae bacterium]MDO4424526.1 hypothetical protein [Planctomycetia bacterium]